MLANQLFSLDFLHTYSHWILDFCVQMMCKHLIVQGHVIVCVCVCNTHVLDILDVNSSVQLLISLPSLYIFLIVLMLSKTLKYIIWYMFNNHWRRLCKINAFCSESCLVWQLFNSIGISSKQPLILVNEYATMLEL